MSAPAGRIRISSGALVLASLLCGLPGGAADSRVSGISADASYVVGTSVSALGRDVFLWTAAGGMRSLVDVLTTDYGLDLPGWTLQGSIRSRPTVSPSRAGERTRPATPRPGWRPCPNPRHCSRSCSAWRDWPAVRAGRDLEGRGRQRRRGGVVRAFDSICRSRSVASWNSAPRPRTLRRLSAAASSLPARCLASARL